MPFANDILAGVTLVRAAIRSPNYVAGVSGWTINNDGSAEFNNGTFRGNLVAGSISIGTSPNWFNVDSAGNLWLGGATFAAANFSIDNTGLVTVRSQSGAIRLQLTDSSAAPFQWPSIYEDPFGGNGSRQMGLTSGKQGSLTRAAGIILRSADATPFVSYIQLDAQQIDVNSSPGSVTFSVANTGFTFSNNPVTVNGTLTANNIISVTQVQGTVRVYAGDVANTQASWALANFVASSPGGTVANISFRTLPLASQIRVGNVVQDMYFRDAGDTAFVQLQAAAFVIGSRLSTKRDVTPLELDALDVLRKLTPIRYRHGGDNPHGPDTLHGLTAEQRHAGPVATLAMLERAWEASTTHIGLAVDDLAELCPEACYPGIDGTPAMSYSLAAVLAIAIRAITQLEAIVAERAPL